MSEWKCEVLHFDSPRIDWANEYAYGIEVTHWMPLPEPPEDNMTIEKAIDLLETYDFDYSPGMTQAAYMGSAALRIQQEVARSNPLTLDELREMDAPVWCLCKPIEGGNGYWCLCQNGHITTPAGTQYYVDELPHWIFLRRKPEEG